MALAACGQAEPAAAPTSAATCCRPRTADRAADKPYRSAADKRAHRNCAPTVTLTPTLPQLHRQRRARAVEHRLRRRRSWSARRNVQLALYLKASPADLSLQSANAKEWPDGALGCPQDGQVYPQVVTPGFLLIFTDAAQSVQYAVHTGRSAAQMLLCARGQPIDLSIKPAAAPAGPDARMGELARAALAQELAVAEADIAVVAVEETEWRDSSLGCPKPGMNYLQVITPGYKITWRRRASATSIIPTPTGAWCAAISRDWCTRRVSGTDKEKSSDLSISLSLSPCLLVSLGYSGASPNRRSHSSISASLRRISRCSAGAAAGWAGASSWRANVCELITRTP